MNNLKHLKRAILTGVLTLAFSVTALLGSTFAWFSDSASFGGNIIQTGNLDVELYWEDGALDPVSASWKDASSGAIFTNANWKPGHAEARHIKIANDGSLDFNYQLRIATASVVGKLANVIDVYYFDTAVQVSKAMLKTAQPVGTLIEVLGTDKNLSNTANGSVLAGEEKVVTLAFKMQETAGKEYENLSVATEFAIQVVATQIDGDAIVPDASTPSALVTEYDVNDPSIVIKDLESTKLDVAYSFKPTQTGFVGEHSEYEYWHPDFVVKADNTVPADSIVLAGYYEAFCSLIGNQWIGLSSSEAIPANQEVRLLKDGMGMSISYKDLCEYGNDGIGFLCGAADVTGANRGTTLTVELRLFGVKNPYENSDLEDETGESILIGTFTHTFGGEYVTTEEGAELFVADDNTVTLVSTADVQEEVFEVPAGVTNIGGWAFNANIKEVVFPESVRTIEYQAFKDSNVEKVTLSEGITEIGQNAFNKAQKLKSVNIPSTVTSIAKNAFSQTAIEELIVPASVTNIDHAAFNTMTKLKKIVFEADNITFADYACRDCQSLETVVIKASTVTFTAENMVFTRGQNGDANGVTIYVKDDTIADLVRLAQKTAYDYEIKYLSELA